jgi:hypothetical protein
MEGRAESAPSVVALAAEVGVRALGAPVAVLVLHSVLSLGFDAYDRFPWLDTPMHVLGGVAIAAAIERALAVLQRQRWVGPIDPLVAPVLVIGLCCVAALAWECAEFFADRCLGTHAQLGVADTLVDMTLGLAGAAGFLAWRNLRTRRAR